MKSDEQAPYYNPTVVNEGLGVAPEGDPLPSVVDDSTAHCQIHNHKSRERTVATRLITLTNWKDKPEICVSCLFDLIRDGYVNVVPRSDLRELLGGGAPVPAVEAAWS